MANCSGKVPPAPVGQVNPLGLRIGGSFKGSWGRELRLCRAAPGSSSPAEPGAAARLPAGRGSRSRSRGERTAVCAVFPGRAGGCGGPARTAPRCEGRALLLRFQPGHCAPGPRRAAGPVRGRGARRPARRHVRGQPGGWPAPAAAGRGRSRAGAARRGRAWPRARAGAGRESYEALRRAAAAVPAAGRAGGHGGAGTAAPWTTWVSSGPRVLPATRGGPPWAPRAAAAARPATPRPSALPPAPRPGARAGPAGARGRVAPRGPRRPPPGCPRRPVRAAARARAPRLGCPGQPPAAPARGPRLSRLWPGRGGRPSDRAAAAARSEVGVQHITPAPPLPQSLEPVLGRGV